MIIEAEVRAVKMKKYGAALWCPERLTLCFCCNTPAGTCRQDNCILDDAEYIEQQKRIQRNIEENAAREAASRKEKPAKIRNQSNKSTSIEYEIAKKEKLARQYYKKNMPRVGDRIMHEVSKLYQQKGKRNG